MSKVFYFSLLLSSLTWVSCSPMRMTESRIPPSVSSLSTGSTSETQGQDYRTKKRSSPKYRYVGKYGYVPDDNNPYVDKWIERFTTSHRKDMERYLIRSTQYTSIMKAIFREHDLPEDLAYVSLVESGFSPHAISSKQAVGFWQFMAPTARDYDLKIDQYVDERKDLIKSTHAAAKYLKSLYNLFGSWHLALASYNAGESRINKTVFNVRSRDFWSLVKDKKIPSQTAEFVPKIIAAIRIAKDPVNYQFYTLDYKPPIEFKEIEISEPQSLRNLAGLLKVSEKSLHDLNTKYKTDHIPIYNEFERVRIPLYSDLGFVYE